MDVAAARIRVDEPRRICVRLWLCRDGHCTLSQQSDVDLLTVGLSSDRAASIGRALSTDFSALCRSVEIAAAMEEDFQKADDEAYGGRVFLHHYCVRLAGPEIDRATSPFPGDQRAARGFNGDIAHAHVKLPRVAR